MTVGIIVFCVSLLLSALRNFWRRRGHADRRLLLTRRGLKASAFRSKPTPNHTPLPRSRSASPFPLSPFFLYRHHWCNEKRKGEPCLCVELWQCDEINITQHYCFKEFHLKHDFINCFPTRPNLRTETSLQRLELWSLSCWRREVLVVAGTNMTTKPS